jgi:hypothetical protein
MYSPRTIEAISASGCAIPFLLLTGAASGKTTLLRHLGGSKRAYVSLDDPLVLSLAVKTPPCSCALSRAGVD